MAASEAEEDVCPLCLDAFNDPRYLPCGNFHTFCLRPCLQDLVLHNQERSKFPCPVCREDVRIPQGGAAAFPRVSADLGPRAPSPRQPPPRPAQRSRRAADERNVPRLSAILPRVLGAWSTGRSHPAIPVPNVRPRLTGRNANVWSFGGFPGLVAGGDWEAELGQQARLWEENERRQEERAEQDTRRLMEETARPLSSRPSSWLRCELTPTPRYQGDAGEAERNPRVLDRLMTRIQQKKAEKEQRRAEWFMRKEEKRQDAQERRVERMVRKQERREEKERRRQEKLAEKHQRRLEKEMRKQEKREEWEERRMERQLSRQLRV